MRVAFMFFLRDSLGGAERRLLRIYNAICTEDNSIECDIIVRGCDKKTALNLFEQADCDVSNFFQIVAFKSPVISLLFLLKSNYDIVHFFDASRYNVITQLICKIRGKKNVYSICSYYDAYNLSNRSHMNIVGKQLRMADIVDLLYPGGKEFISKKIDKGKLYVTPGTFTDLKLFKPVNKGKIILYAAARLEESKNPVLFIEGINACKNILIQEGYKVYILGKGKYEEFLRKYIKDNGLSDIVKMIGYDTTSKYLPYAPIFCSLQCVENYPSQSLAEAVASGCYVIVTDVGDSQKCASETFASFINCNPEGLADALNKYIKLSDEEKRSVVKNARAFAEVNYSIEASKEYFKNILIEAGKR